MLNDDETKTGLKNEFNDPLSALVEARSRIISCFAEVNDTIGFLSAVQRLSQFLNTYSIQINHDDTEHARLDVIKPHLEVGKPIKSFVINQAFKIVNKNSPQETINFNETTMLPGYTIKPVLKSISENPYSNEYSLDID